MPLYRHECGTCGHRFRILELPGMTSVTNCPVCGSRDIRRLLPRVSVQFKGSGYYRTDYGRRGSVSKPDGEEKKRPEGKESKAAETHSERVDD
jgi:putative FmdB family regulatory protein